MVVISLKDSGRAKANRVPAEKLRRASDIVRMWSEGVSPDTVPNLYPSKAEEYVREALASNASDAIKQDAQKLLQLLDKRKHYFAFANSIQAFLPAIPHYVELWKAAQNHDTSGANPPEPMVPLPKCLALTLSSDAADASTTDTPAVFFDAAIIDACGERIALKPSDIGSLLIIEWRRKVIGQYEVAGAEVNGLRVDFTEEVKAKSGLSLTRIPMYRHIARLTVLDYPSGNLRLRREFEADDPREQIVGKAATGNQELRKRMVEYVHDLATGKVAAH